jgi:integrase
MSVERTATGTWRVRWREAGRNRAKTIGSKADAKLFDAEITRRQRMGDLAALDSGKQTLEQFAEQTWWPLHVQPNLARATRINYAGTWDRHVLPTLGDYPLREITAPVLRRHFADMRARGVGAEAIKKTKLVLQSCLRLAVEEGLIPANPAQAVKLPRAPQRPAKTALGPRQVETLRASLSQRDAALVSVLAYVGLRPGEALALRWGDIHERTINVERAADDGQVKATKTGHRRSARLMAPVKTDLAAWRLASGRPADETLVFPSATGNVWREHDWRNWRRRTFQPAAQTLGLDLSRPYDLRHACASLWLAEGRSVVEVGAWLGHSPTMCLSTYSHVITEMQDQPPGISAEDAIRQAREPLREAV